MNLKEICEKDRELQRKGLYNTSDMKKLHSDFSIQSNEKELLKKLLGNKSLNKIMGYKEYVIIFCR